MNDIFPILVSFIYVIAVLLVAYLLESHGRLGRESARKLVHFLVSLWVFVMVYWMDSLWARILGPIAFIFINTFMTLKAREGRAVGMIFFPVALLAVSILYSFSLISAETAISSVLVMGAGDSAAALIGTRYGRHQLFSKSIEGFTAMFAVSRIYGNVCSVVHCASCLFLVAMGRIVSDSICGRGCRSSCSSWTG